MATLSPSPLLWKFQIQMRNEQCALRISSISVEFQPKIKCQTNLMRIFNIYEVFKWISSPAEDWWWFQMGQILIASSFLALFSKEFQDDFGMRNKNWVNNVVVQISLPKLGRTIEHSYMYSWKFFLLKRDNISFMCTHMLHVWCVFEYFRIKIFIKLLVRTFRWNYLSRHRHEYNWHHGSARERACFTENVYISNTKLLTFYNFSVMFQVLRYAVHKSRLQISSLFGVEHICTTSLSF